MGRPINGGGIHFDGVTSMLTCFLVIVGCCHCYSVSISILFKNSYSLECGLWKSTVALPIWSFWGQCLIFFKFNVEIVHLCVRCQRCQDDSPSIAHST